MILLSSDLHVTYMLSIAVIAAILYHGIVNIVMVWVLLTHVVV